jgi:hypothetical protein
MNGKRKTLHWILVKSILSRDFIQVSIVGQRDFGLELLISEYSRMKGLGVGK